MTGTVSWETLIWIVGAMVAAGGTVAGFLFWVYRIAKDTQDKASAELEKRDMEMLAIKADMAAKAESLARDLAEYQRYVGETFVTKTGMSDAMARVERAVENFVTRMDEGFGRLSDRIDRLLDERRQQPPQSPRSRSS